MTTRDLGRLAHHVKRHRLELYPSRLAAAQAAGISKDTWQKVEDGEPVRESTYAKIDRALHWAVGSCIAVAEGGTPALVSLAEATASAESPDERRQLSADEVRQAAFEAARAKLPTAPIGDIDAFSDALVEILRRAGSVADST